MRKSKKNAMPPFYKTRAQLKNTNNRIESQLAALQKENTEWQEQIAGHCIEIAELNEQLAAEKEKNKRLREFARPVIRQYCWNMLELDGGDIQEWAEKLGLIVPHTATEDDVDDESDFEVGYPIFIFSDTLKGE